MTQEQLEVGMRVHYDNGHGKKEIGIVKSIHPSGDGAFVVYHCSGDWDNYGLYTGALTRAKDLVIGWDF